MSTSGVKNTMNQKKPESPSPRVHVARARLVVALLLTAAAVAVAEDVSAQEPDGVDTADVEIEIEAVSPQPAADVGADTDQAAVGAESLPPTSSEEANAQPAPATSDTQRLQDDVETLRISLSRLEQDLSAEREARRAFEQDLSPRPARDEAPVSAALARAGLFLSGYVQTQYGQDQLSEDELLQGGTPLNQDRFVVRRGRLLLRGRWTYVHTDFELDGSNTRGPTVSVRRASVGGVLPGAEGQPDLLHLTVGLTTIPFGLELQQGQDEILFLERTTGSLAFFAGPVDTGATLSAAYSVFRLQLAVMNGVPLDDRAGGPGGIDPTRAPDYLGRVGVSVGESDRVHVAAGASFLSGTGFHPGSDATKGTLLWDDQNADGQFSTTEVVQVAGRGALPSETFRHWAVGADARVDVETRLGVSSLYGEVTLATNLDRALFVADPTLLGADIRELNWYLAVLQDLTPYVFVGARYEAYDPNSDLLDTRRGQASLWDATITTVSPLLGLRWPEQGRLTFQYDWVDDKLGRDRRGVPTDVANNRWTLRLQGEF